MPSIPEPHLGAWRTFLNAHAAVTDRVDEALDAAGLPPLSWYDVLWALRSQPDRTLRMGDLARGVVTISRTGLTRLVDRLEDAEMLRRHRSDVDRRGMWVTITPDGEALLRRMWPVYAREIERCFVDVLGADEAARLGEALARVRAAADPAE